MATRPRPPCAVCGVPSSLQCGRCRVRHYCSADHQRLDWISGDCHKQHCVADGAALSFEFAGDAGRLLRAMHAIAAGVQVFEEDPLVALAFEATRCCVSCLAPLPGDEQVACTARSLIGLGGAAFATRYAEGIGMPVPCPLDCGLFYCSMACCEASSVEHSIECAVLRLVQSEPRGEQTEQAFNMICDVESRFILRALAVKLRSQGQWGQLTWLQSHLDKRTPTFLQERAERLQPLATLLSCLKLVETSGIVADDLVRLDCIREVNGIEIHLDDITGHLPHRLLFVGARQAMLQHDCTPNCLTRISPFQSRVPGKPPRLILRTLREVSPGEVLAISYVRADLPRLRRQQMLVTKYFVCCCRRCAVDESAGDIRGAPRCPNGCKHVSNHKNQNSTKLEEAQEEEVDQPVILQCVSSKSDSALWTCSLCNASVTDSEARAREVAIEKQLDAAIEIEEFVTVLLEVEEQWAHSLHYLVFRCLFALAVTLIKQKKKPTALIDICEQALRKDSEEASDVMYGDEMRAFLRTAMGQALLSFGPKRRLEGQGALLEARKDYLILQGAEGIDALSLDARLKELSE